jgi:DNA-binding XRE family transcriptional regulator
MGIRGSDTPTPLRSAAMTMLSDLLTKDRARWGFTVGQVAWRVGVTPREYRELEAGERVPSWDAYDQMAEQFGWPGSFVDKR